MKTYCFVNVIFFESFAQLASEKYYFLRGFTTNSVLHLQWDLKSDQMRGVTTFCTWLPYSSYVLGPFSKGYVQLNP